MPLSAAIIALIRDEIGNDADFSDDIPHTPPQLDSLENIYTDELRGEFSPLVTALICWRRRLKNLQTRSFDISTEGSLLSRSQRIRFIEREINRLEHTVDDTAKSRNAASRSPADIEDAVGAEFS